MAQNIEKKTLYSRMETLIVKALKGSKDKALESKFKNMMDKLHKGV
jgi:hypothetical protein